LANDSNFADPGRRDRLPLSLPDGSGGTSMLVGSDAALPGSIVERLRSGSGAPTHGAHAWVALALSAVLARLEGIDSVRYVAEGSSQDGESIGTSLSVRIPTEGSVRSWLDDAELVVASGLAGVRGATHRSGGIEMRSSVLSLRRDGPDAEQLVVDIDLSRCRLRVRMAGGPADEARAAAIANASASTLEAMLSDPSMDVADLLTVSGWDPSAVAAFEVPAPWGWNGPLTVPETFAIQVRERPAAIAVCGVGRSLTYAELDAASWLLATRLADIGVGPGSVVALVLPRGPGALAAMLAVMRAGAAYLPIDPGWPRERIAFMVADADARVAIVDAGAPGSFANANLAIDPSLPEIGSGSPPSPGSTTVAPDPDRPAYLMYTSGSTGRPKGVEIRHRSIIRLVCGARYVTIGPDTRMLQAAPLGFDASTLEIWGPLLNGGCCVLHPEAVPTGPGLARTIRDGAVDTAWLTASLFNAVVDHDPTHLRGLVQLLVGGEALSVPHVRRAIAALRDTTLINGYGPTECTTFAATYAIPDDLPAEATSVPIGRPITGTVARVLDGAMRRLPVGVVGELCLGGDGLASRYLNLPELTAERFVADPYGQPGDRLYRTGDLARWRSDGLLEYIGRRDDQVKIRGYRVEPGEVEAALAKLSGVRACAVVVRHDPGLGPRLFAYAVPERAPLDASAIRETLGRSLPAWMVPAGIVEVDTLPMTANGKLDRAALPPPPASRPTLRQHYVEPVGDTERVVASVFADTIGLDRVGALDGFFDLGGTSLAAVAVAQRLELRTGRTVPASTFFDDPTPRGIARAIDASTIAQDADPQTETRATESEGTSRGIEGDLAIAIVGMSARLPGAADLDAFWTMLDGGVDGIRRFDDEDLDPSIPRALRDDATYVRARGVIDGVEGFDAAFFGMSANEADLTDPQQRVMLELCWTCLEHAGHVPDQRDLKIGVFAGVYNATYFRHHVLSHPGRVERMGEFQAMLANEKDYVATRIAHRLDLTGPAISVFTACSTSLVAIAQAVDALRLRRCDLALAGGAAVTCPPESGYLYQEGSMLSPDGRTRPFSADAAGTVFSDGAAVVLLRRLSDALADGDTIHAVIRGVAVNNDGGGKASFTAPSVAGQVEVIRAAHRDAAIDAGTIEYVEAHGTATPLGDPVEVEALNRAFGLSTRPRARVLLGSVKGNVGHTVMAAGAAGLIKTVLAMRHDRIPATLHFDAPNPRIPFGAGPFEVAGTPRPWPRGTEPRWAGISAFGVGGTNAHVVISDPPPRRRAPQPAATRVIRVSARTPTALSASVDALADWLERTPDSDIADVEFTLHAGRSAFAHRVAIVADDARGAIEAMRDAGHEFRVEDCIDEHVPAPVLLFPGQGAQYVGMGTALYGSDPVIRRVIDACADAMHDDLGFDLRERLVGASRTELAATSLTQPALFALELALATRWVERGIRPAALVGHSIGEFAAAALAGVMSLEDAARLVVLRGSLMQRLPAGRMLAIRAAAGSIGPRLPHDVAIASVNAPGACVVAGPNESVERLAHALQGDSIPCSMLDTSHAFHSPMMDPVVAPFREAFAKVALRPPSMPIVSTATGARLSDAQAVDPGYWATHLRTSVLFSQAVSTLVDMPGSVFIECGPRAGLSALVRQHRPATGRQARALASLGDAPELERSRLALAEARLWTLGVDLEAERGERMRIPLPTYPFERTRHWLDANPAPVPAHTSDRTANVDSMPPASNPSPDNLEVQSMSAAADSRVPELVARLRTLITDVSGIDVADADPNAPFVELGLDSLTLTQVALQVKNTFKAPVTFRQLMEKHRTLDALARCLDEQLPGGRIASPPAADASPAVATQPPSMARSLPVSTVDIGGALPPPGTARPPADSTAADPLRELIRQQLELMKQQLALLGALPPAAGAVPTGSPSAPSAVAPTGASRAQPAPAAAATSPTPVTPPATSATPETDDASAVQRYDVKKAFGAIARIHTSSADALSDTQRARLDAFIRRYVDRTRASKAHAATHRPHLADPRVVNGFRPLLKEIVYQIVVERSSGARVWDIDGNEYVDVLNGFGMSLFGWQPPFVTEALRKQIDAGYEIGPQHPLAGEVARLVCEMTGFDRAGLCNTGSEAVMGALRIARTVTGRSLMVSFAGAYHGIFDEVVVRGTRTLRTIPAAPGIMPNAGANVLVLDYGTPESARIVRERADEIAAVLVEPVQSRRPDFQPREFLHELRDITSKSGSALVFDEVVTGFRAHPGGVQALFGIRADMATYGKVIGGGLPIGVIAGKRAWMDALDGGAWQYGDDSIPTVGVTYFAGTFVRHPLALAAAHASLRYMREQGPELQASLTTRTAAMCDELNAYCREVGAPIELRHFASVWRMVFTEEHPLQDLLFPMMRSRGIHVLDNFPCFMTTAHSDQDVAMIKKAFRESIAELQEGRFLPGVHPSMPVALDASKPPVPGARLGRDGNGQPAWFIPNPDAPGKYMRLR
jgi:amino acid adenylation domain-containing protein